MVVVIDGRNITKVEDIHNLLKRKLSLPDYYGMNLDALWDVLSSYINFPLIVIWKNFDLSPALISESNKKIANLFQLAENEINDFNCIILNSNQTLF